MPTLALLLPLVAPGDWFVDSNAAQCAMADGTAQAPFCTIREALAIAISGDEVFLATGDYVEDLAFSTDVKLTALAPGTVAIRSELNDIPVIDVFTGVCVELYGVRILDGRSSITGSIAGLNVDGSLILRSSTVSENRALGGYDRPTSSRVSGDLRAYDSVFEDNVGSRGGALEIAPTGSFLAVNTTFRSNIAAVFDAGAGGGAIFVEWGAPGPTSVQLELRGCTLSHNIASGDFFVEPSAGGAIMASGQFSRPVRIENTTFSGNDSSFQGAMGFFTMPGGSAAQVEIHGCTVTDHESAGIVGGLGFDPGEFTISNSMISGNTNFDYYGVDEFDIAARSLGGNVLGGVSPDVQLDPSDQTGVVIALGPLDSYGGQTQTHAVLPGTEAVGVGVDANALPFDQRGVPRPLGRVDAGAYQSEGVARDIDCQAVPNSTGTPSITEAWGSATVNANVLQLRTTGLPPQAIGYYLAGTRRVFEPMPGGSIGNLCAGGIVGRLNRPTQGEILAANGAGRVDLRPDLTDIPSPTGSQAVLAGQTRVFQFWHRDGALSNFSTAVSISYR